MAKFSLFLLLVLSLMGLALAFPSASASDSVAPARRSLLSPEDTEPAGEDEKAEEEDAEDEEDDDREDDEREYSRELSDKEFKLEAKSALGDKVEFEVEVEGDSGIGMKFEYESETGEVEVETKFKVRAFRIIEYRDNLETGVAGDGYQKGEEVQTYVIGSGGWEPLTAVTENITLADGTAGTVEVFTATTADKVFSVVGRYSGVPITWEQTVDETAGTVVTYTLNPSAVKFDMLINDFPYTADDTTLAVEARFRSKTEVEGRDDKGSRRTKIDDDDEAEAITEIVTVATGDAAAKFTWSPTVFADGVSKNVINTAFTELDIEVDGDDNDRDRQEGDNERKGYFSFGVQGRVKSFNWDPTLGATFGGPPITNGAPTALAPLCLALYAILAAIALRV